MTKEDYEAIAKVLRKHANCGEHCYRTIVKDLIEYFKLTDEGDFDEEVFTDQLFYNCPPKQIDEALDKW